MITEVIIFLYSFYMYVCMLVVIPVSYLKYKYTLLYKYRYTVFSVIITTDWKYFYDACVERNILNILLI